MTEPRLDAVVLVAGASSGMGAAIAASAAAAGARVVLLARRADRLAAVQSTIEAAGGAATSVVGDATDPAAAQAAVQTARERYGRLDVLVNSVGTNIPQRALTELTAEGWAGLLHTNLDAAFVLTAAVLPEFRRQQDGLLLHISSSAARRPDGSGVGYQASKAGVAALAHATMVEEQANGVRVTVLYPGFTATDLVQQRPTPPTPQELERALQPQDVADLALAVLTLPARAYVPELAVSPSRS